MEDARLAPRSAMPRPNVKTNNPSTTAGIFFLRYLLKRSFILDIWTPATTLQSINFYDYI